ncbi:lactate/malate family dehydrogenase [Bradyrhizobium valentinum]|uniref:Lactate dehydrogenase n=1 Tax=Bradyrhizobium valentinum TaxID=1518501 RepID=A0A0R3L654_9BRAD|nr:lactate dehydrogenase [Bradyrhizobium valentinum]KRR03378.1 lactate dehydrogenase [Bradyrhizobium valentinum]
MKIGIVGAGAVGAACAMATLMRGCASELVLVNRARDRARGMATDMGYGAPLSSTARVTEGDYSDLAGAALIMITAGVNEKSGGATDRSDPLGRLRLLDRNAEIYRKVIPPITTAAPDAVLLVVTDPPDPLAYLTRELAGHERVLSTGTLLDSLRFRVHLGRRLRVAPTAIEAQVLGEHGTSQIFHWSAARVGGVPLPDALEQFGVMQGDDVRTTIENEVRYANITIIEGIGASQYGIGMVCARIAEIVLRDERTVVPIGAYNSKLGVTLSLPGLVGRDGCLQALEPPLSNDEHAGLKKCIETLRKVQERIR